ECWNLKNIDTDISVSEMQQILDQNPNIFYRCGLTTFEYEDNGQTMLANFFEGTINCSDGTTTWYGNM
ncbi:MAG: hypothetical protein J6128_03460, partial [Clostridia bacterium]|nr:hypothetical protein [Clostridia bacterium]